MQSNLKFFHAKTNQLSDCGQVLDIEFSNAGLDWTGVILEKGSSPHFYPQNVYTPYFYFALALDQDLHWSAKTRSGLVNLKTSPGDIWINPPNTPFSHHISEPCHFVILAIQEEVFLEKCSFSLKNQKLLFLNNYNVDDETIKGIMELFLIEAKANGRNGNAYLNNLLSLLATHYVQNYSNYVDLQSERAALSRFDKNQLAKVDSYIFDNMANNISVDELADLLNYSKFYFLREFKKLVGITPYQYLMDKRLEQAKVLLSKAKIDIAAISLELGFNDQPHFTRAFKKQFGVTPGQFQKQVK